MTKCRPSYGDLVLSCSGVRRARVRRVRGAQMLDVTKNNTAIKPVTSAAAGRKRRIRRRTGERAVRDVGPPTCRVALWPPDPAPAGRTGRSRSVGLPAGAATIPEHTASGIGTGAARIGPSPGDFRAYDINGTARHVSEEPMPATPSSTAEVAVPGTGWSTALSPTTATRRATRASAPRR